MLQTIENTHEEVLCPTRSLGGVYRAVRSSVRVGRPAREVKKETGRTEWVRQIIVCHPRLREVMVRRQAATAVPSSPHGRVRAEVTRSGTGTRANRREERQEDMFR